MFRAALIAAVLLASPILSLATQAAPVLAPGDRVRVRTGPWSVSEPLVGTVVEEEGDSLRLLVAGQRTPVALALAKLQEIEISRGRHSHSNAGQGALIGLGIGSLAGAGLGVALWSSPPSPPCKPTAPFNFCGLDFGVSSGQAALVGGVLFGALGAGLGALVGSGTHSERWERIALDHAHASMAPYGARLALSFTF